MKLVICASGAAAVRMNGMELEFKEAQACDEFHLDLVLLRLQIRNREEEIGNGDLNYKESVGRFASTDAEFEMRSKWVCFGVNWQWN